MIVVGYWLIKEHLQYKDLGALMSRLNNDVVNLIASLIGSGIAYKVAELIGT